MAFQSLITFSYENTTHDGCCVKVSEGEQLAAIIRRCVAKLSHRGHSERDMFIYQHTRTSSMLLPNTR
jgi:hypothetical protein